MKREILITAMPQETRVAILEDDVLVELMVDRPDAERLVGDVYIGQVQAVLPGIQAAFVDIGTEKAAFLHVSDVAPDTSEDDDEEDRDRSAGKFPPIQDMIAKGQRVLVQASKEPIGTKGPRVTTHISLPGRFLVLMPGSKHVGVSRKIEDREREHAAQPLEQAGDSPGLVAAQDELGVRACAERRGRAQLGRRAFPVVHLAVVDDPDIAARVGHRLVRFGTRVDDRKPRVQQAVPFSELRVLGVRATWTQRGLHCLHHPRRHRLHCEKPADTAHG